MTKEVLLNKARKLAEVSARGTDAYRDMLEFFESNVCIPKGENRHPDSDILHEWIEGAEMQAEHNGIFSDYGISALSNFAYKYRIKPSEPAYVYKFTYQDYDGTVGISDYLSEKDAIVSLVDVNNVSKLEWTKKENQ